MGVIVYVLIKTVLVGMVGMPGVSESLANYCNIVMRFCKCHLTCQHIQQKEELQF